MQYGEVGEVMAEAALTVQTAVTMTEQSGDVSNVPSMVKIEEHPAWSVLARLPITMTAEIALSRFKVRDLLGLAQGQVFESVSPDTEDVPLKVGSVQLGWTEFEVVEQKIALRLTRLA